MKKAFATNLYIVVAISMLAMALFNFNIQINTNKQALYTNALMQIDHIGQVLSSNDSDVLQLTADLKEDYFIRAKAAAYIVQNTPEILGNLDEIKKVASLLQIDELHLFDTEGRLFDGSEPKYYDYTFNSGEQMQFFLPMLDDYSLELSQDILPNTAEKKLMQYIAVWRDDHKGIVQIGMEPIRLLEAMSKNEIPYIFNMISANRDTTIFALDSQSGVLLGSTKDDMVGKSAQEIGLDISSISDTGFQANINGEKCYCVIRPVGNILICVSSSYESIYYNLRYNMVLILTSLFVLSIIIIVLIMKLLDRYIIHGIHKVIHGMKIISSGNLDYRLNVTSSPEFNELSNNTNNMVASLLEMTGKLSLVFENVNIPIAVYEYSLDMLRVLATSKIADILMLDDVEASAVLSDHTLFNQKILEICSRPFNKDEDIYLVGTKDLHYVKIKFFQEDNRILGIIVDVTNEILEKQEIKHERDTDSLTGLYGRRAFLRKADRLFEFPQKLGAAAILMADVDNLKYVNDQWGHAYGDELLKEVANLLNSCDASHKLVARLGGDEFALLIYNFKTQQEAQDCIERLYSLTRGKTLELPDDNSVTISISGGYTFLSDHCTNYHALLALADQAMYSVKKSKKGVFLKYEE